MNISKDDYLVACDEEIGIIYASKKGCVKTIDIDVANTIAEAMDKYFNDGLCERDKKLLEDFLEKSFSDSSDLRMDITQELLERDSINKLEIIVANDCNLNCRYCYEKAGTFGKESHFLKVDDAIKYLDALLLGRYRFVDRVLFFGGEPLINLEAIKAICNYFENKYNEGAIEKSPSFLMITNGTLMSDDAVKIIKKYKIIVTISIDGSKVINDKLRVDKNGEGTFSRIERGINLLRESDVPPLLLEATFTSEHVRMGLTKREVYQYLKEYFKVERVLIADCMGNNDYEYTDNNTHANSSEEFLLPPIEHTLKCLSKKACSDCGCDVAFGSLTILPNGDIYPCHFLIDDRHDYRLAFYETGKYNFDDYRNVITKFHRIKKSNNPECRECWAKNLCHYCAAQMILDRKEELKKVCEIYREQQKYLILKSVKTAMSNTAV